MTERRQIRSSAGGRRGTLVVAVLVCISVAGTLAMLATSQALRARRQGALEHQRRQTEFLLLAGVNRSAGRLSADPDYAGETWEPAAALPGMGTARVEIRRVAGGEGDEAAEPAARMSVVAVTGRALAAPRVRLSHEFSLPLEPQRVSDPEPTSSIGDE